MANAAAVVAGRDFLVYSAAFAASPGNAMPADTVLWGSTPAGWTQAGYTVNGLNVSLNIPRQDIRVDQELDPVLRVATGRDIRLATDLAEVTAANLKLSTGTGTITTVNPISGTRGHDQLDLTSAVTEAYNAVLLDIRTPGDGESFRILAYKTLQVGNVQVTFRDTQAAVSHFEAAVLPDPTASPTRIMAIRDVIPALP